MLQDGFPPSHVPACCSLVAPLHFVRHVLLAGASTSICASQRSQLLLALLSLHLLIRVQTSVSKYEPAMTTCVSQLSTTSGLP